MRSYVYILQSSIKDKYYIGSTFDIQKRFVRHNKGEVRSTKFGIPWILKYYEAHIDLQHARARENQIKRWKKRVMIEKLISKGPIV